MKIQKSSRHSKITGNFGEYLVLYWLSKHGFECAHVDHTGIDVIARNPTSGELMGISVKSRCRMPGTERDHLNLFTRDFVKAREACESFRCVPYFAIVVDDAQRVRVMILPLTHLQDEYGGGPKVLAWQMSDKRLARYCADPAIKRFELRIEPGNWW